MRYRRFGKTELLMPVITCGGMRFQQTWKEARPHPLDKMGQANIESIVSRALELGINHFETARGYGSSEYQLGRILPALPRERIIVQTKVAPQNSESEFLDTFAFSIENLKLDRVDLLAVHGINTDELLDLTLKGGTLRAIRRLQRQGVVGHVGFSSHAPTSTLLKAIATDEFSYVNLHWYYFDQINWPAIALAHSKDMGVFIISPCDKGGKLYAPPDRLVSLCRPLTPMAFNDLFCLSRPEVHTLSIGVARPSDFDAHLTAIEHLDLAAETIAPIVRRLEQAALDALGSEWMRLWNAHLPELVTDADTVPLYHVLRLYTLAKAYDMVEFGKMRYNLLGSGGHWFPGRKVDVTRVAELRAALSGNPLAERLVEATLEAHALFDQEDRKRLSEESD